MRKTALSTVLVTAAMLLASALSATAAPRYTWLDLGTAPYPYNAGSFGYGLNAAGQVAGSCETINNYTHASLYRGGVMEDLGTLPGYTSSSCAYAINDPGQVVGSSNSSSGYGHAFLYDGVMHDLGGLNSSFISSGAYGINAAGQVVGSSYAYPGNHAFLWTSGSGMQDLGVLPYPYNNNSAAYAINALGQVVGSSSNSSSDSHAFLWTSSGGMEDLGTLPEPYNAGSYAYAINAGGQVAGDSYGSPHVLHAFLYNSGVGMQDLGTLGGNQSHAAAINKAGQVVGWANYSSESYNAHAFLWSGGAMYDLNGLVQNLPVDAVLSTATGINDGGQIVANSTTGHAYLLTPVSPASALAGVDLLLLLD